MKKKKDEAPVILNAETQTMVDSAENKSRARKNNYLSSKYADGELVIWPDGERGIPNELVRCALFSAKNRKEKRRNFPPEAPHVIPIIGDKEVRFIGWELRQDDETVWMQLVHLAKQSRTSYAEFTPYSFIKAIKWTVCGASYKRLLESIMRLDASSLVIYSRRFHKGVSVSLIADFEFSRGTKEPWKVRVFDQKGKLLALFDKLYSRIDFKMRLALPEGVTTWLHSFLASHQAPCYHKIETLAVGAGITLDPPEDESLEEIVRIAKQKERLRAAKKIIRRSLEKLQEVKFLENFEITRSGLVRIEKNQKHNRKLLTSTSKKTINL